MKHTYLAPALFLICGSLNAQIQITSADMPVVGDELTRYSDTIPNYGPGGSGPDQFWDFSAAQQGGEQVTSVVDPTTTPSADQFGGSNLAFTTDGLNFSYLTNTASEMTVDGFAGDPLGDGTIMIDAPFDPALTLNSFPRQHTSAFTDDFGFDVTVDGSGFGVYQARIKEVGVVFDTTDGYGTITTPMGTYDCLRSRLVTIRTDSIWAQLIQILPFTLVQSSVDTTVTYIWHAVETKLPVAEMTVDSLGNAVDFTWSAIEPNSTVVEGDAPTNNALSLFPQPALDRVRISVEGSAFTSATVNDLNGRTVLRNTRVMANDWLDLSDLPAGVYVVNATTERGERFAQRLMHLSAR